MDFYSGVMSAMSASSGLMPLSLISEHKAAQGGPPPVQPLTRTPEKHNLVQAPKPTPNGMEPSPPLIPLLPPTQPEPQPSLPCGGKSEIVTEEERSGGSVPEMQVPAAEPAPPSIGAILEQPLAAAEPAEAPTAPEIPVTLPALAPAPSSPALAQLVSSAQQLQPEEAPAAPEQDSLPQPEAAPVPEPAQVPLPEPEPKKASEEPAKESKEPEATQPKDTSPIPAAPTTSVATIPPPPAQAPATRHPKRTKQNSSNVSNDSKNVLPSAPEEEETSGDDRKSKRKRLPTQIYQSPIPELNIIAKISKIDKTPASGDDKLIVFYRNEFLAVRNTEGGFYVCQAMQNVYRTSSKIRIRWLSQVANTDHFSPDFYDYTEFDCILTNLNLEKLDKNKFLLPDIESQRTQSILKRAIDVENGTAPPEETSITEEHPDGLDLSLYRNEDQLKKRKRSKSKGTKQKDKKESSETILKKSRTSTRKSTKQDNDSKKSLTVPAVQRRLGKPAKVEKPVVQRIIAAKKMGRRKLASSAAVKQVKKEVKPPPAAAKRKIESQPPAVPEKKVKSGASKTRSGATVAPSVSQQRSTRRTANRTK